MTQPLYFAGLDVGGTSMKAGIVTDEGDVLGTGHLPTEPHRGQQHGLDCMCETIRQAIKASGLTLDQIAAVGVATPGTMDIPGGLILDPPNLKPWKNVPVRDFVQKTLGKPTAFQNDANAAAYGEFWIGAGRHVRSMVLFTLGTGIGGGVILGDTVLEGEHSHGAEVGHIRIEMTNPRQCGCGAYGCLEAYASATNVARRALEASATYTGSSLLQKWIGEGKEITAKEVFDAENAGDALADRIVEETAYYLAVGATNLMHTIDPDMVVFGGGMIAAGDAFLERIRKHVRRIAFPIPAQRTQIIYATLGSDAGLIGAAGCARLLYRKMNKLS